MPRALFVVDSPHETNLPAMEALTYTDPASGELAGGWWVYGEAPRPDTVLVCVDTSDAQIDAMTLDETHYLFVSNVAEGVSYG